MSVSVTTTFVEQVSLVNVPDPHQEMIPVLPFHDLDGHYINIHTIYNNSNMHGWA